MSKKVVCVSGYFDPLHHGHIDYLHRAKALARNEDGPGTLWGASPPLPARASDLRRTPRQ
jgi:FAD synthase